MFGKVRTIAQTTSISQPLSRYVLEGRVYRLYDFTIQSCLLSAWSEQQDGNTFI